MEIIHPPIRIVSGIIGVQKYKEAVQYRKTRHQIILPCEDGTLFYHMLTGELLLLRPGENEETCRMELIRHWFLVPQDFDECKQSDDVRQLGKLLQKQTNERTSFTILTTTDCNARCYYCYEMGISRYAMTPETAKDVGEHIVRVCGGEKVKLSWFGGEPLYNAGVIDVICSVLQEHTVEYSSIMTSNGFYLDAQTALKAIRDWHVHTVQITIDGTESVYNRTKAFIDRDVSSPFQRVMDNIESALDASLNVVIRLNMDRANAEDLFALVDVIADRFGHRSNLFGRVALLGQFEGKIHAFSSAQEACDFQIRLQDKLKSFGMEMKPSLKRCLHFNQCMADNDSCEVILPDGRIERCEHVRESEVIGTIFDEARDAEKVQAWRETMSFPECKECEMYPMCVILKKCEWNQNGCPETRRNNNRRNVKAALLADYRREKEAVGKESNETETGLYLGGSRW